eukprot:scaffold1726_cov260-Pinguiococcus_pyrenoidosus.AAC.22
MAKRSRKASMSGQLSIPYTGGAQQAANVRQFPGISRTFRSVCTVAIKRKWALVTTIGIFQQEGNLVS